MCRARCFECFSGRAQYFFLKIFGSFQALENLFCVQAEVPRVCNYEDILEFAPSELARPTLCYFHKETNVCTTYLYRSVSMVISLTISISR